MAGIPDTLLATGQRQLGFVVQDATPMPSLRAVAYRVEHEKSGARLLHVHTEDEENLFSVSFPTLPFDHTGVAHILEHSVLSGSRRYPVRDPFFEMVKMSMATFINAMTGWDCTYYPGGEQRAEARSVQPRRRLLRRRVPPGAQRRRHVPARKGHHLAPAEEGARHRVDAMRGIVYNEMKGVFSDPKARMYRRMTRRLFPDTVYSRESGGDPVFIPELTWEGLRSFHQRHYHPSNAYFVVYGDIPTEEYLAFLSDRLDDFERRDVDLRIDRQPRWTSPIRVEETYPVGKDESLEEKTFIGMHWLTGLATDVDESTLFNLLDLVLFGHEAAPLKKALVDARLGQDLLYTGASPVGLENTFCLGIKGSEPDRVDAFEELVRGSLKRIADQPIDPAEVDTAFRQAAYHVREISSQYPLTTMERVLESWIYGGDPLLFLRVAERLDECRRRLDENPRLLNELIRERLIDNPHCLTAIYRPDPELAEKEEREEADRVAAMRADLSADDVERIIASAAELEERSGVPNSPEALASLPQLRVSDLPPEPKLIPHHVSKVGRFDVIRSDLFANGVSYLCLDFDLSGLDEDAWRFVPYYVDAVEKMGTERWTFEETARRVAASTGGVSCAPYFDSTADASAESLLRLRLRIKMLDEQVEEALQTLHELLFAISARDLDRLRDVVSQSRAWIRNHLVHQGSLTAARHAGRGFSLQGHLGELTYGLPQLALIESVHGDFEGESAGVIDRIESVQRAVIGSPRPVASFTGSDAGFEIVRSALDAWSGEMPEPSSASTAPSHRPAAPAREGLAAPIQVAHCAMVMPAPHVSHPDSTYLALGARILGLDYLINEVRFKGNAYGASCSYSGTERVFSLGSYRDPHLARTIGVFEQLPAHVESVDWSPVDIERAVIGTAKRDGAPIRPGIATSAVLSRFLRRVTDDMRRERYQQLLAATPGDVKRALTEQLEQHMADAAVCIVSSRDKLEEANRELGRPLEIRAILD